MYKILFITLFSAFSLTAQEVKKFRIEMKTLKHDLKQQRDVVMPKAEIQIVKDDVLGSIKKSNEKGIVEFTDLEFGHQYKLICKAKGCIDMFALVDANIPEKYQNEGFGITTIFYENSDESLKNNFVYPFAKAGLINGKEFKEDTQYGINFQKGIIPDEMVKVYEKQQAEKLKKEKEAADAIEKQKQVAAALAELEKKKIKIAGKLTIGETPSKPLSNMTLNLLDSNGKLVQTVTTNFLGAFVFYILPDNDYSFWGEENSPMVANTKVVFSDKNDKEQQSKIADSKGKFQFDLLKANNSLLSILDKDLKMDLKGKFLSSDGANKTPIVDLKVNLMSPTVGVVNSVQTDKEGRFSFNYLSSNENYTIVLDQSNKALPSTVKRIILENEKGETMKAVEGNNLSSFKFEILPEEKTKMSRMYVDDPWLKVINLSSSDNKAFEQIITERVYFAVNDDKILPDAQKVLDKIIAVMKASSVISIELSSHTDSQGADDYNLKLSERRAKAAVDYMVKNGIPASRLIGKGYGETHLLNKCNNSIRCTEEEHALNRRLEFKVVKK